MSLIYTCIHGTHTCMHSWHSCMHSWHSCMHSWHSCIMHAVMRYLCMYVSKVWRRKPRCRASQLQFYGDCRMQSQTITPVNDTVPTCQLQTVMTDSTPSECHLQKNHIPICQAVTDSGDGVSPTTMSIIDSDNPNPTSCNPRTTGLDQSWCTNLL